MPAEGTADDPHSRRLRHVIGLDRTIPTPEQVRAARRAYYGACSFFDDNAGLLLEALNRSGMAGDTIVILLSDHGEMLGGHGLWFKMNFFEGSCRIPLMISVPDRFTPRRASESVSLVDLLPTLVELTSAGKAMDYATPLDGHSLLPHCLGVAGHDGVIGEYTAEGAVAPVVMIRRGPYKFIHCPADPDQLFDLTQDPGERVNLAGDAGHAEQVAEFRAEVARRWDLDRLQDEILASQKRRHFVADALKQGTHRSWDHQPVRDAAKLYVRSHMPLDDIEARARFPAVGRPATDP
jgi:choline-sulfatase